MKSIETFIEPYIELEQTVRELMSRLFSGVCSICTACCCRADICEEAPQSAFLARLLQQQKLSGTDMDDRFGWLGLQGCTLQYGRPPVCYTYFCDELLEQLPDEESRYVVRILGRLIEFTGEDTTPELHLTEIKKKEQLDALDPDPLFKRLEQAQAALDVIQQFCMSGRLTGADRDVLDVIGVSED